MKKEEKTKRTYDKIIKAAIVEFGTKSYENAAINTICNENQISKGLLYHNFKNKDELYLKCVEICFHEITTYLQRTEYDSNDFRENIKKLLTLRQKFFQEYPHYGNLFFYATLQPPKHLLKNIREMRRKFDDFLSGCYKDILSHIQLRDGITVEMALEYFMIFQEMFNGYFQNKANEGLDFLELVETHEMKLSNILDVMLYGIAKENEL